MNDLLRMPPSSMTRLNQYRYSVSIFVFALLILVLKSPDAILTPQFWAEDGPIFFAAQFQHDWPQLLIPYAGYLHTVTRLIAWVANFFDVLHAPLIYNSCAILVDAVCISFVTVRAGAWFPRWAVLASFFIVPTTGEIFGSATNVQWFMQFAIATACFMPAAREGASSKSVRFIGYVVLAFAALSGPFSVLIVAIAFGAKMTTLVPGGSIAPVGTLTPSTFAKFLRAIRAAGSSLPKINILIVAVCAAIQGYVLTTNNIRVAPAGFILSAEQFAQLGFPALDSFYYYSLIVPFTRLFCMQLICMASMGLAWLIYTVRHPSAFTGATCLMLALGAVQPILAYLKMHEMHAFATSGRYAFLLSVVCCWIAARILCDIPAYLTKIAIVMIGIVISVGIARSPDYFRRRPFHDLAWKKYANQIRTGVPSGVVVPVNPVPWHFKLKAK